MATRTHRGSCHCGAVRFEAELDLAAGTVKCNCTLCSKQRNWAVIVPRAAFRLQAGGAALSAYRCRTERHLFCATCGVRPFGTGTSPRWGEYVAVSVHCLDDATAAELAAAPVTFLDGRNDDWTRLRPSSKIFTIFLGQPSKSIQLNVSSPVTLALAI